MQKIPQMSELTGSNHRCRAQIKCAQTVIGQRFAVNGPNGLSYDYYYYYYYYYPFTLIVYGVGVRCARRRFSVNSPFLEKSMVAAMVMWCNCSDVMGCVVQLL